MFLKQGASGCKYIPSLPTSREIYSVLGVKLPRASSVQIFHYTAVEEKHCPQKLFFLVIHM